MTNSQTSRTFLYLDIKSKKKWKKGPGYKVKRYLDNVEGNFVVVFFASDQMTIRHRWRDANFDLCSALMANEQSGVFSVQNLEWDIHLLCSSLRTRGNHSFSVELSLPVLRLSSVAAEPTFRLQGERSKRKIFSPFFSFHNQRSYLSCSFGYSVNTGNFNWLWT